MCISCMTLVPFCRDDGVGLAAPQVGVNVRLMVYNGEWDGKEAPRPEDQVILVNPRIVSTSKSTEVDEEGCLSFQDKSRDMYIRGKVEVSAPACRACTQYWCVGLSCTRGCTSAGANAPCLWRCCGCIIPGVSQLSARMNMPLPAAACVSSVSLCLGVQSPHA